MSYFGFWLFKKTQPFSGSFAVKMKRPKCCSHGSQIKRHTFVNVKRIWTEFIKMGYGGVDKKGQ